VDHHAYLPVIRAFRFPDDYDSVLDLWKSMEKGIGLGRSDEFDEIRKKMARDPDLFLVAELNSQLVGSVMGGYDGRRGLIYHLAVRTGYRGLGIGTRLLDLVEERLRSKGCLKCYLLVTIDNSEAMQFYEQHDWQHMHTVRLYGKELQ
jgi:ribosomal protein S18 acetylase RimI-like enzyme